MDSLVRRDPVRADIGPSGLAVDALAVRKNNHLPRHPVLTLKCITDGPILTIVPDIS